MGGRGEHRRMVPSAVERRHLPLHLGNPFTELPLDKMKVEDAKPIFVFTADAELTFLKACSGWAFPISFTLAKTGGRRVGSPPDRGGIPPAVGSRSARDAARFHSPVASSGILS